jgi:histidinol phosphatase-like PHP family hydrolase
VPPDQIDELACYVKGLDADVVVVPGETVFEHVAPGTNAAAQSSAYVDILALRLDYGRGGTFRPARNGVFLEITSRCGHNRMNGHALSAARRAVVEVVVQSDAHAPDDLMSGRVQYHSCARNGVSEEEVQRALSRTVEELLSI